MQPLVFCWDQPTATQTELAPCDEQQRGCKQVLLGWRGATSRHMSHHVLTLGLSQHSAAAGCFAAPTLLHPHSRRLVDVDMHQGTVLHPYVWSLGAFWPGLQALAGQVEEGAALHANWTAAWRRFGWLPEMFDVGLEHRHPTESGGVARPVAWEGVPGAGRGRREGGRERQAAAGRESGRQWNRSKQVLLGHGPFLYIPPPAGGRQLADPHCGHSSPPPPPSQATRCARSLWKAPSCCTPPPATPRCSRWARRCTGRRSCCLAGSCLAQGCAVLGPSGRPMVR